MDKIAFGTLVALFITYITFLSLQRPVTYFSLPALRLPRSLTDAGSLLENYFYIYSVYVIAGWLAALSAGSVLGVFGLGESLPLPDNATEIAVFGVAGAGLLRFGALTQGQARVKRLSGALAAFIALLGLYLYFVGAESLFVVPEGQDVFLAIGVSSIVALALIELFWWHWCLSTHSRLVAADLAQESLDMSIKSAQVISYLWRGDEEVSRAIAQIIRDRGGLRHLLWVSFNLTEREAERLLGAQMEAGQQGKGEAQATFRSTAQALLPPLRKHVRKNFHEILGIEAKTVKLQSLTRLKFIVVNRETVFLSWPVYPLLWDHPVFQDPAEQRTRSSWILIRSDDPIEVNKYVTLFERLQERPGERVDESEEGETSE